MEIQTHQQIDRRLCGEPVLLQDGYCHVRLLTTPPMAADQSGLIHGGFIFGAADYAAMLAVNHPNVVLAAASVKFLKPVKVNEALDAEARVTRTEGRKRIVFVRVQRNAEAVCEGEFSCFVPDRPVILSSA